jgi:agmatinase
MKASLQSSASSEFHLTAHPVRPFLNWNVVNDPAQWDADVMILGLPLSEPYPHQPFPNDQALAPDAIRMQSGQFCDGPLHWDFDLGGSIQDLLPARCVDGGNILWSGVDYEAHLRRVRACLRSLWAAGTQVFVLGGDHGVTIPVLEALDLAGQPVHVVHIDAHLDWRDEVSGVRRGYSSPLRRASELACVTGMTQIGLRGTGSARKEELDAALAYGSRLISADELHRHGIDHVLDQVPAGETVYVTIDADGLDPSCMPGVQAPSPGGLHAEQVTCLLRSLAMRNPIIGMDVVEVAPSFDFANKLTCITAGRLILNAIGTSWHPDGAWRRLASTRNN